MPDMVETYAGVGAQPWWVGSSPTVKDAKFLSGDSVDLDTLRVAAGLDWTVSKQPTFVTGQWPGRVPGQIAIQRDSDGAIFGTAKEGYHLFQNSEGFEFVQALLGEAEAQGLTAGAIYGGARAWVMVKLDGTIWVRGDGSPLENYLLATWGHTGRHALILADTTIRVVCANTVTAAVEGATDKVVIRHTPGMADKVEEARKALDIHSKYVQVLAETLKDLATREMTIGEVTKFTEVLLPANPDAEKAYRTEAERESIVGLFAHSKTLVGVPNTAYRAYQAVAEYTDNVKVIRGTRNGSAEDRRADSILDGSAYKVKSRALDLLVKA